MHFCLCSSSLASRMKRSVRSTPSMTIQPSLTPDPRGTLWTGTSSSSRTWSPCTLLLHLHRPLPHRLCLATGGQCPQAYPLPRLCFQSWTSHWTMARTIFPRSANFVNSCLRSRRRSQSLTSCLGWTVSCEDQMKGGRFCLFIAFT